MGGGGGELRYEISQNAPIKLALYARKHKTAEVNGVLVGRVSPQKNDVVEITDSVPLFHAHLGLLPNLEISLILVYIYLSTLPLLFSTSVYIYIYIYIYL